MGLHYFYKQETFPNVCQIYIKRHVFIFISNCEYYISEFKYLNIYSLWSVVNFQYTEAMHID